MFATTFFSELASAWQRSHDSFWPQTLLFLTLTVRALGLALLLGIPTGLALTRLPRLAAPVIAILGVVQPVPGLVLLGLLIPLLGIGQAPAVFAAMLYSLFPVVLNTYVGITQVPASIRDAARGMGMTDRQVLWQVDLPLALPVVFAGVRAAAVYATSIIVMGAYIGAGGLGDYVLNGMSRDDAGLIWLGALPVLALALALFWALGRLAALSQRNSALGLALGGSLIVLLSAYAAYGLAARALQPRRADLLVGAKDFTEGQILAEIVRQMIEAHTPLRARVVPNLGTSVILKALQQGEIDLYPEYTGVLLTSKEAVDQPVPADRTTITPLVRAEMRRRHGLMLLQPFGLNNTYAPCVTRATAQRHALRTLSDVRRVPALQAVVDLSFLTRPDGWQGLVQHYDLHFDRPPRQVSPSLLYKALEQGEADLVIGFATDWQIEALRLVVLDDDRGYFPSYHAAPLVRASVLQEHPEVGAVLERLAGQIDDAAMRKLNYQVAVEKRSESEVALDYLRERGLLATR